MGSAKRDDEVFPNAAALDVGASSHWVAVAPQCSDAPVREVGTMTEDLHALADWLHECGVDVVALESTGVYWIPAWRAAGPRSGWSMRGRLSRCRAANERRAGLPVAARGS
jgi:transposase